MRELYERCARPLARVIRGLQVSWDPVLVTTIHEDFYGTAVWSPCNRFIAVARFTAVDVFDAAALERLNTFKLPYQTLDSWLSFSPDSRILTQFNQLSSASWDLQTGVPIRAPISAKTRGSLSANFSSFTYSADGKVIAVLGVSLRPPGPISTYDLFSGTHICSFSVPEGRIVMPIWTHGEHLRFVTLKLGSATVWEVSFTSGHTPVTVQSLPAPDEITGAGSGKTLFLPALCQLAFIVRDTVLIWDAPNSRFLLKAGFPSTHQIGAGFGPCMSFSSDGGFFACTTGTQEFHVWKKTPAGYAIHQKLALPPSESTGPLLSPNGESIVAAGKSIIRLWHTKDQILSLPSVPAHENRGDFIPAFSPNEELLAFARSGGNTVTILGLRSGDLRLTIDVGMGIWCLGVIGSTVVVAGEGKIITWNLPAEDYVNAKASINESIHTAMLNPTMPGRSNLLVSSLIEDSISPDLTRIAIVGYSKSSSPRLRLQIHDTSSGGLLAGIETPVLRGCAALDESGVWCTDAAGVTKGWKIIEGGESIIAKLESLETTTCPPRMFRWQSRRGYEVTHDGWVLSPTQKRLLWLPHHWRSEERSRTWSGQFLGLTHCELPEVVILEFFE